jgi:hypothetical protein
LKSFQKGFTCENLSGKGLKIKKVGGDGGDTQVGWWYLEERRSKF